MKFRKKPVVVEAMQFDGSEESICAVLSFVRQERPALSVRWEAGGILIPTMEGLMRAEPGDWIIKGVKKEFYPCKPDIFVATYEPIDPQPEQKGGEGG